MIKLKRVGCILLAALFVLSFFFILPASAGNHLKGTSISPGSDSMLSGTAVDHMLSLAADPAVNNSSTIIASPPPTTPNTVPVAMQLVSNFVVHRGGLNKPAPITFTEGQASPPPTPAQGWALIELVFTGNASGTVYDSGYSFNVDNNTLFWGSSPEYGNWTVYDNLTVYSSLLTAPFAWRWNSPGAIVNGTFVTSIELLFYPADEQFPAPSTPNLVIPILPSMTSGGYHISPSDRTVYGNVTVPFDTTAAILQIWVYGFSFDEFWYSNEPSFRDVIVNVSSTPIWSLLPFPYINTGGIDLFAWRPITGVYTMNDRLYMENITAALGMIEGPHEWSFNIPNLLPGWSITASLLLYTNPAALGATLSSYEFQMPLVSTSQSGQLFVSPQATFNQSAQISFAYSSYIRMLNGYEYSATSVSENFVNDQFITPVWENITGTETTAIRSYTSIQMGSSLPVTEYSDTLISYPLAMDTFFTITVTHTTNGGYPMYGNASFGLTNLTQAWIQSTNDLFIEGIHSSVLNTVTSDIVNSDADVVVSNLTLISPTAGILGAITHVQGFTGKLFASTEISVLNKYYIHRLQAGALNLTPPNYVQPLLVNIIISVTQVPVQPHPSSAMAPYFYWSAQDPLRRGLQIRPN